MQSFLFFLSTPLLRFLSRIPPDFCYLPLWVIVATDTKTSFLKTLFSSSFAVVLLIKVPPALHRTFPIAGLYPYLSSREVYETKSIVGYLQTFPLRSNLRAMSSPSLNTDRKAVRVESLKRCCLFIAERMLSTSLQYTVSWSWWYFFFFTSFIYSYMSSVIRVCCIIPLGGRFFWEGCFINDLKA